MIHSLMKQNETQATLLASKDIGAFAAIQGIKHDVAEVDELLSDDEIALREAKNRPGGLTDDERIYFTYKQLI